MSKVKRTSAEIATVGNPMFYVEGTGFFKTLAVDPAGGGVLAAQYCDNNGTVCHSINDFYDTGHIDSTFYTRTYINNNYYTT